MITLKLAFKDILHDKMRSLSLFFFIFVITITLVMSVNFLGTIEENMQSSITNCFTGDVLLRSGESSGNEIYSWNIDAVNEVKITPEQASKQLEALSKLYDEGEFTGRIRYNGMVSMHLKSETAMFMGINPNYNAYKESLILKEGSFLSPGNKNTILMTQAIADALSAKVGEKLVMQTVSEDGQIIETELEVIGIAEMKSLSFFSIPIIYVDLDTATQVLGYKSGELTDIMISPVGYKNIVREIDNIKDNFNTAAITEDMYMVQKGKDLSGYIMDFVMIFSLMFIVLIVFLFCIIGILVINLIVMMGMQRKMDIGIMRAIGFGKRKIAGVYFLGIMLISTLAMILGVIVSFIILGVLSNVGITNITGLMRNILGENFYPTIFMSKTLIVLVVAIFVLAIFAYLPCRKITNLTPVDALKEN